MKKFQLLSILLSCTLFLSTCLTIPVSANSAQTSWSGVSSTGAVCQAENSPLEVKKEVLTFDLPDFPYPDEPSMDLTEYHNSFTAEYTFFNPSEYTITASLLFPFGTWPSYVSSYDDSNYATFYADLEKYNVTVDGVPIEKEIRHSLNSYDFVLDRHLKQLQDHYREDDFFKPDIPVTHQVFQYSQISESDLWTASIGITMDATEDFCLYFPEQNSLWENEDGTFSPRSSLMDTHGTLNLYTIGELPEDPPEWEIQDGEGNPISGKIKMTSSETMTLEEMVLQNWTETCGISKIDWYNAMLEQLILTRESCPYKGLIPTDYWIMQPMNDLLMCWYSYEITLEPGQELVNTVTAPLFPDIDLSNSAPVCNYEYLLSPAKTWNSFSSLDIRIRTPYCLIESTLGDWDLDEEGYFLHLDGLPDKELALVLSTDAIPDPSNYSGVTVYGEKENDYTEDTSFSPILIVAVVVFVLLAFVLLLLFLRKRKI